ncbi:MAG: DNA translocase FtsK [Planctomycetes bacterium ADurb.Bin412]|nr:MAG: DNA translocase FtsK [Planctomycetes bacterium ADurb.Bin412]
MLIAGKTGSGKSTLLHVIITNLALWYSPDQVELYLIDFKKGVEFKTYVTHQVPHIRAVAIESDREFGLSILRRLEAEMTHRGDLFRKAGVQDLASYRAETGNILPRTVLIVDEFQVFFSEDDKLGQDAAILLEQLVRQGRAFGVHVLLGSQTLGGASGLARSTMGQMAVRIALQCSEADSQLILDDDNVAARLLSRPGEAIYNDAGGMVVGNCPFQTAWLPESTRDEYLTRIAKIQKTPLEPMIVFEGNIPADITANRKLSACLSQPASARRTLSPYAWLGEPVAIKDPTAVVFRRQSGANLLLVGQQDVGALGVINAVLVSLAAQLDRQSARFFILEGSAADSPHAGQLQKVASALPHEHRNVEWRAVPEVISEIAAEVQNRIQADQHDAPARYLFIYGLQRYRILRRQEEEFGFSMDQEAAPKPDKQFAEIIREGPPVGVHVIVWADTLSAVERTLNRQTIREFDNRVLFQMGAADSSNLIDSPLANQLGFHRALFFSEEQGLLEKFRPYAPLTEDWLAEIASKLNHP